VRSNPAPLTLTITRKGGKVVTIPMAPRTARAIDLAVGERTGGPVFLAADGRLNACCRERDHDPGITRYGTCRLDVAHAL
jgi:hypothetical protein